MPDPITGITGSQACGAAVEVPLAHLSQGEQRAFYARGVELVPPPRPFDRIGMPQARGRVYAPLGDHLRRLEEPVVELGFARIERILGRALPASARRHRAWWSNEAGGGHSQAAAWMGQGWLVDAVDFTRDTVRFRRGHS